MCGRLACGLQPEQVCRCCRYKEPGVDNYTTPQWINSHNSGKTYKPSYNICPTEVAPVLISGVHFKLKSRAIAPMIFGVIPQWSKVGDSSKYSTINCRIETIQTSKLYGNLLGKGQRCVVICNGYYEWQKQPHGKSPYFIHAEQPEGVAVDDPTSWNLQVKEEEEEVEGSSGLRPLKLAALFEIGASESMGEKILSFTVITREASCEISWLHARMPAVLETDEQVNAWLNIEEVDASQAIQCIFQKVSLISFPVSSSVNAVAQKGISCIRKKENNPKEDGSDKKGGSLSLLEIWLGKGQKRKSDGSTGDPSEKITKEEL